MRIYLGIDGGQSHTTALVADEFGRVLGSGTAGPSNHTREPGGRERLISALELSTGEALRSAGLGFRVPGDFLFTSAHLAMTGEPEDKISIVHEILKAGQLTVAHDAPAALAGALSAGDGLIVLAGTGSVACGRTADSEFVRVGGHGYLFGDRGSAFAMAQDALSNALAVSDRGQSDELTAALAGFFERPDLNSIVRDVYAGDISRDRLAAFAARLDELAETGSHEARLIIDRAAQDLAEMAILTSERLGLVDKPHLISYGGGVFKSPHLLQHFKSLVTGRARAAEIVPPRFGPHVGALLLAYSQAGIRITPDLLQLVTRSMSL